MKWGDEAQNSQEYVDIKIWTEDGEREKIYTNKYTRLSEENVYI
jgi:hypothetical protein